MSQCVLSHLTYLDVKRMLSHLTSLIVGTVGYPWAGAERGVREQVKDVARAAV